MDFLLQPNTVCRIISLGANPDVTKRLAQMGILPGTEVTIVRVGPFGDPFEIAVTHGQNIALRREEVESLDCEVIALPLTGASPESFIMELPPYRLPLLRTVGLRSWQEVKDFLYRATTLIIAGVILVWFLTHYPGNLPAGSAETLAGRMGRSLAPLFEPIGIHWQESVALIFGFIAKEIVIGAMAVIYGGEADLAGQISAHLSPLQGLSFMVFTLIYTPCVATLAVIRTESRSWKITASSLLLGLGFAWMASFLIYQGGRLLGFQ